MGRQSAQVFLRSSPTPHLPHFFFNRAGMEIVGPVIVDFYDAQGKPLFSGAGKVKCTKIQAEPLN